MDLPSSAHGSAVRVRVRGADQDPVTSPDPWHSEVHPGPPLDTASPSIRAVQERGLYVSRRGLPRAGHLRDGLQAPGVGWESAEGAEAERHRGHDGEGVQERGLGAAEGGLGVAAATSGCWNLSPPRMKTVASTGLFPCGKKPQRSCAHGSPCGARCRCQSFS